MVPDLFPPNSAPVVNLQVEPDPVVAFMGVAAQRRYGGIVQLGRMMTKFSMKLRIPKPVRFY